MELEVKEGVFMNSKAWLLNDCLDYCGLADVKAMGGLYTWQCCVHGQPIVYKKLDKIVFDVDWRLLFPNAFVKVLLRIYSDHNQLLMCRSSTS